MKILAEATGVCVNLTLKDISVENAKEGTTTFLSVKVSKTTFLSALIFAYTIARVLLWLLTIAVPVGYGIKFVLSSTYHQSAHAPLVVMDHVMSWVIASVMLVMLETNAIDVQTVIMDFRIAEVSDYI